MKDNKVVVLENKDGSYIVTGSSITSVTSNLNDTSNEIKVLEQKIDNLSVTYGDYLTSKQYLDGFIVFGIFVLVGLLIGKFLYGLFNN